MASATIVFKLTLDGDDWFLDLETVNEVPAASCSPDDNWVRELIKDEDLGSWDLASGHRYRAVYKAHSYRSYEGEYDVETFLEDITDLGPLEAANGL